MKKHFPQAPDALLEDPKSDVFEQGVKQLRKAHRDNKSVVVAELLGIL
jgi:hypothetical protein